MVLGLELQQNLAASVGLLGVRQSFLVAVQRVRRIDRRGERAIGDQFSKLLIRPLYLVTWSVL